MRSSAKYLLVALIAVAANSAHSQALGVGQVLVSNPSLNDPFFSESVLMIVFHDANIGTAGILLNRPTWVDPTESFPEIGGIDAYDGALYLGGPVAPTELWALLEFAGLPLAGVQPVVGDLYVSLDPEILSDIDFARDDRPKVRLYAGRAEWGPGQLAQEIANGDWRLLSARPEDVFSESPQELWQRMPLVSDGVTASRD